MISQETAGRIWNCYREIAAGEKLLEDMAESQSQYRDVRAETLKDAFGDRRHLSLGVPSGDSCRQMFDVAPGLAKSVIKAHIANKRAELAEANEQARIELMDGDLASLEKTND